MIWNSSGLEGRWWTPQIRSGTRAITVLVWQSFLSSSEAAVATCEHPSGLDLLAPSHRMRGRVKSSGPHQRLRHSLAQPPASYMQICPRCTWTWEVIHRVHTVWKSNWKGSSFRQLWGSNSYGGFPEVIVFGNITVLGSSILLYLLTRAL